jgi:hypothetical protein
VIYGIHTGSGFVPGPVTTVNRLKLIYVID